jgi:RNase P subunit RPR2
MNPPKATLSPAYVWDCDSCGLENFQRCITRYVRSTEELQDILGPEAPEIEEGTEISLQTAPESVVCKHCHTKFPVDLE